MKRTVIWGMGVILMFLSLEGCCFWPWEHDRGEHGGDGGHRDGEHGRGGGHERGGERRMEGGQEK